MALGILLDIGASYDKVQSDILFGDFRFSLDLDVTEDEVHEWSNEVTTFPVEVGSKISDHIQPMPDKLTITGVVTNSAFSEAAMKDYQSKKDRCQSSFDTVRNLMDGGRLLTVYTKHKIYTGMALKSTNIPRNAAIGDSIRFKMEFIHFNIVNTKTIDVPPGISKKLDKKNGDGVKKKTEPQKNNGKIDYGQFDSGKQSVLKGIKGSGY